MDKQEAAVTLATQAEMVSDLTPEQRERYEAIMNPHRDCPHAPYCAIDHM